MNCWVGGKCLCKFARRVFVAIMRIGAALDERSIAKLAAERQAHRLNEGCECIKDLQKAWLLHSGLDLGGPLLVEHTLN